MYLMFPGRSPAPAPPRRDPRTTLSVGRARAKSMVAGLGKTDISKTNSTKTAFSNRQKTFVRAQSDLTESDNVADDGVTKV